MPANWKNQTLFHGDNLTFLRAMNSESVDLILTNPPFKKAVISMPLLTVPPLISCTDKTHHTQAAVCKARHCLA